MTKIPLPKKTSLAESLIAQKIRLQPELQHQFASAIFENSANWCAFHVVTSRWPDTSNQPSGEFITPSWSVSSQTVLLRTTLTRTTILYIFIYRLIIPEIEWHSDRYSRDIIKPLGLISEKNDTISTRSNTTLYKKIHQMRVQLSKGRDKI